MVEPAPTPFKPTLSTVDLAAERQMTRRVFWAFLIAGLVGSIPFVVNPLLDIQITEYMRDGNRFALSGSDVWSFLRRMTMFAYAVFYITAIAALVIALTKQHKAFGVSALSWAYIIAAQVAGPLVVTNLVLKEYVDRPRPREIIEFGGNYDYKALFEPGGACEDNCSFVSGEVSSMVMIFAALYFALPNWRRVLLVTGIPAWMFSAYMRVGQGGHFPSDTFLAGVFMVLIAAVLYRFMVLRESKLG